MLAVNEIRRRLYWESFLVVLYSWQIHIDSLLKTKFFPLLGALLRERKRGWTFLNSPKKGKVQVFQGRRYHCVGGIFWFSYYHQWRIHFVSILLTHVAFFHPCSTFLMSCFCVCALLINTITIRMLCVSWDGWNYDCHWI